MVKYYSFFLNPQPLADWLAIYRATPVWSLIATIAVVLFYYYFLNWISAKYYKNKHWWLHAGLNFSITFLIAFAYGYWGNPKAKLFEIVLFASINAMTFLIAFVVLSIIVKCGSPHARFTPAKLFCN